MAASSRTEKNQFSAVDLFAGAGGLSLGAVRAGFEVPVAVEIDERFAATYERNHRHATMICSDVSHVSGADLLAATPKGKIDLVMGCAPCQGFCALTAKQKRNDPRNSLVVEMARLIEETAPSAILMENVPGITSRGEQYLGEFLRRLKRAGYLANWWNVQMADYGVPQKRRRFVLMAGRGFEIDLPSPTHARKPSGRLRPWRTLRDAIYGEQAPQKLSKAHLHGGPLKANWHVVRDLSRITVDRLRAAQPGTMRTELSDELLPGCHQGGYDGFRNVYMRMDWDSPSPTITAGCTTPAKGRFGHPDRRRTTISVREAATLQTFPKSFRFDTDRIEVACQMIGNAVPPAFARVLTSRIRDELCKRS